MARLKAILKLTKEVLKNFSIAFSRAKELGITDEDLKYIYEVGKDKFRISIRIPNSKERSTKLVTGLLDAINIKWDMVKQIEQNIQGQLSNNTVDKSLTIEDGIKKFMKYRENLVNSNNLEFTTYEDDVRTIDGRFIRDTELLTKLIVNLTKKEAQDYVDDLWKATNITDAKLGEKLSENTIYKPFALLHKIFEYFRTELELIEINPFSNVKNKPKYTPKSQNYLVTDEIKYVLKAIERKNIRFKSLVNLVLETGLRIEELTAIKWSDINRLRGTVKISRALRKSNLANELIIKDVKTDSSEREITFSQYTLELLDNYRKFKNACGIVVTNDDFIFTAWDSNELVDPARYSKEWTEFIKDLGFKNLPLKNVRHTSATFMLQDNPNLKAVQKRFGHSKATTTLGIYNQSNYYEDKKLLEKFEKEFRNNLGYTIADLYRISVNRLQNKRQLNKFIQDLIGNPINESCFEDDLRICQDYLFNLYPIFNKIAEIDSKLDDDEIEAIYSGFTEIYSKIKLDTIDLEMDSIKI